MNKMNTLPNCRLLPVMVRHMQEGDRRAVDLWALWTDLHDKPFLAANAPIWPVGAVKRAQVIVSCKCDGFHIDLAMVPVGHRWPRRAFAPVEAVSVAHVENAQC